ncbi:uncharacterized protein K452DRAFT_313951 [Aplosporella prunicola CBS 121167]|uniref:Uncharacterized protein n=1 Tax=Aplosporella prunicola CBS 121167 TaxID=1176127 RepID=A0A6A6AU05_9PEZI|nr:uncharacterized protein K452DRAFT_313951 [Aplosporella prunicola CBS 121167]KAF2135492.1 hypothetical protein K452DRAFT_313951 [Aplosporella prunicola CBS 121167]
MIHLSPHRVATISTSPPPPWHDGTPQRQHHTRQHYDRRPHHQRPQLLTDPFFSPAGSTEDLDLATVRVPDDLALDPHQLPAMDDVLLSHEGRSDNIDGRHVLTTVHGARTLGGWRCREGVYVG